MQKPTFHFYIDVVGTCNLRCPSCPVGNSSELKNTRGIMSPVTLDAIMRKAVAECNVTGVGLYNWTEPLIHPRLDEMVRIVRSYDLHCAVSTNLNISKPDRYRKLLEANPSVLRISLSGFSQATYGVTHKGGDIETVKRNLQLLINLKTETRSSTRLVIAFHRYLTNLHEESEIAEFCKTNEFEFLPMNALMLPLEKVLAYSGDSSISELGSDDFSLIEMLALPLQEALSSAKKIDGGSCKLLEQQVTLNWEGKAMLCCATFDEHKFLVGNFLEHSIAELQSVRRANSICISCIKHGASNYFLYNVPDMDKLVANNMALSKITKPKE